MLRRSALVLTACWSILFLSGCEQAALDWSPAEASKALRVDTAHASYSVDFGVNTATLSPSETRRLAAFVADGGIQPGDRVTIAAAGDGIMEKRRALLAKVLLRADAEVTLSASSWPAGGPNSVVLAIERSVVRLPDCPNWSKPPVDYTGAVSSNFGCATATNLGLMIADPADLTAGRASTVAGPTAADAVRQYHDHQGWGSLSQPTSFATGFEAAVSAQSSK